MGNGEAGSNFDLGSIFGTGAYQGANDPGGLRVFADVASDGMVEDGEDSLEARRAIYQPLNLFYEFPLPPLSSLLFASSQGSISLPRTLHRDRIIYTWGWIWTVSGAMFVWSPTLV